MKVNVEKTVPISFKEVVQGYASARQGGKATGIDDESWADFEQNLEKNLYVVWNRLASGSYFLQPVRLKMIPKADGKQRKLFLQAWQPNLKKGALRRNAPLILNSQFSILNCSMCLFRIFLLFFEKSFSVSKKRCSFAPNMPAPLPVRTAQSGGAIYFYLSCTNPYIISLFFRIRLKYRC